MEMNIYWNDLSQEGRQSMLDSGFEPTNEQEREEEPIGVINTEERQ